MNSIPFVSFGRRPLVGHLGPYYGLWGDSLGFFREAYRQHGPVFRLDVLGVPHVVLLGPKAQRLLLEREHEALSWGAAYGQRGERVFGKNALPLLDGEPHRCRRSALVPSFRPVRLGGFTDALVALTRAQTAGWEALPEVNLLEELTELTFRAACLLLMGVELADEAYRQFRDAYQRMFGRAGTALRMLGLSSMARQRRQLEALVRPWVEARRAHPGDDVISGLLSAGFGEEDVLAQLLILLFAGHDTTKSSLSWTLALLHQHPEVLARVRAERAAVFGDGPVRAERLKDLVLLERVVREANRLYPPSALLKRGVVKDLEFEGHRIPAGWKVVYAPIVSHRLPDVFADPDRFDPDRFAPPRDEHKQPYALVDFGGGYRTCIGKEMSLLESKVFLAELLHRYELELVSGQRIEPDYAGSLTRPRGGVRVHARLRVS